MEKRVHFNEVRNNNIKSFFLFIIFILLIAGIGYVIGFVWGNPYLFLIMAIIISLIYGLIVWFSGGDLIMNLSRAKLVTKAEYPHLFHAVHGLAIAANIPKPKVYVIKDSALNAFATGRSPEKAAIAVTSGLLNKLNRQELEGVVAHEMSHIKNYDIRTMMLAAIMVGVIVLLSDFFLRSMLFGRRDSGGDSGQGQMIMIVVGLGLAILAPLIAQLIKLSVSRKREYAADATAAILTRYPPGLASALKKISEDPDPLVDSANRATAHLYISTPFKKKKGIFTRMFSTHPPIDERIKRLEQM